MSYVVHVWDQPIPETAKEADEIHQQIHADEVGRNPKFVEYARRMMERHPCASHDDEWTEMPFDGETTEAVYSFLIVTSRLEEIYPSAVETARQVGLVFYDSQNGNAYLPDGSRLAYDDPLPAAAPAAAREYERRMRQVSAPVHEVRISGMQPGFGKAVVAHALAKLFKRTEKEAAMVLDRPGMVVKRDVFMLDAIKYRAALEKCGCTVEIVAAGQRSWEEPESKAQAILRAAETGDSEAQCDYGCLFDEADTVERDIAKAIAWWRKSAAQGNPKAQFRLAKELLKDEGNAPLFAEGLALLRQSAQGGQPQAQLALGDCHFHGKHMAQNPAQAFEWYQKAALQGEVTAQSYLAEAYLYRFRDKEQAYFWCRKAADAGHPNGLRLLAKFYETGDYLRRDMQQSLDLYRAAANGGNALAAHRLGELYEEGTLIPRDDRMAAAWYDKGVGYGDTDCMEGLAWMYFEGRGVEYDGQQAIELFQRGAELGNSNCQVTLGDCYLHGTAVRKDEQGGVAWIRKSAGQDNSAAIYLLGHCHETGKGVRKDARQAFDHYLKASQLGYAKAQHLTGSAYWSGKVVPRDVDKARYWLEKAAAQGFSEARDLLDQVRAKG